MFFHIFTHIKPHHIIFAVKQCFGQRAGQLQLADSCRSQKMKEPMGLFGSLALNAPAGRYRLQPAPLLSCPLTLCAVFHPGVIVFLFHLLPGGEGDAGPAGHYLGYIISCNSFVNKFSFAGDKLTFCFLQLFFQGRDSAVLVLGHLI